MIPRPRRCVTTVARSIILTIDMSSHRNLIGSHELDSMQATDSNSQNAFYDDRKLLHGFAFAVG